MTGENDQAGRPRRERKENADMRRRQLLDAAQRSIVRNGLAKTTLATVAQEAGLSQGVAVFYYKSKNGLLAAALDDIYRKYETNWRQALEKAGDDPRDRLWALIEADFDPEICNQESLSIWFAFWGEQNFTPQYASITQQFDLNRSGAIRETCAAFFGDDDQGAAQAVADWIDTLTDGYWQRMHLFPETCSKETALEGTRAFLVRMLPDHFGADRG